MRHIFQAVSSLRFFVYVLDFQSGVVSNKLSYIKSFFLFEPVKRE